jgi:hypothetical protein
MTDFNHRGHRGNPKSNLTAEVAEVAESAEETLYGSKLIRKFARESTI